MKHESYDGSTARETVLIAMTYCVASGSKYLTYDNSYKPFIPSIRKFLDYLSYMSVYYCFCQDGPVSALDALVKKSDTSSPVYGIETPLVDKYVTCHGCMALRVGEEFYIYKEVDVELLFQYCVSLFQNLRSCKDCPDRSKTGCSICQLEQAILKVAPAIGCIGAPIAIERQLFESVKLDTYKSEMQIAPFQLSDFFYYNE